MRFLLSWWFPFLLFILTMAGLLINGSPKNNTANIIARDPYRENEEWLAPSENEIPFDEKGDLIRYGKELVAHTSFYLGPKGIVAQISNGMNCQNCHIDAGTQNFGNPFSGVINNYPKYRDRSGRIESTEFRVNECMQRSMNGNALDSLSLEMKALVAYVKWVGKYMPPVIRPTGMASGKISFLSRAADPQKGKVIYTTQCQRCHGNNGEGALTPDGMAYTYPPLWGEHSYNVGAGILRLSGLAAFIKNNMPFGVTWKTPQLTDEEAWDAAAFVASQKRPEKFFSYDWKDLSKKPFDYPFGPYSDSFSGLQHKYGPFKEIVERSKKK